MAKIKSQGKNVLKLHTNMLYWYNYLNTRIAFGFFKNLYLCEFHEKKLSYKNCT